jgi:hypothetical protein
VRRTLTGRVGVDRDLVLRHLHSESLRQPSYSPFTGAVVREQGEGLECYDGGGAEDFAGSALGNHLFGGGGVAVVYAVYCSTLVRDGVRGDENVPFTSNMRFKSCSVKSSNALTCAMPAFATMVFRGPSSETEAWTRACTSCRFETSAV